MLGRKLIPILSEGFTPTVDTNGFLSLSTKFKLPLSFFKKAVLLTPVSGTKGYVTITFAGTYAIGDVIRVTFTARRSGQDYRKSFVLDVVAGITTLTQIADYFEALILAEIANGGNDVFSAASNIAGVLTVTQANDDKIGIMTYVDTDSAAGTVTAVATNTVRSEGQPSDLVDNGIPSGDINLASYDTVRIEMNAEVPGQFIGTVGTEASEVVVYLTPGKGAILANIINNVTTVQNIGTVQSGTSVVEKGDSVNHVTVITINSAFPAIAGGANLAVGKKIYAFPAGAIHIKATKIDIDLTALDGNINADTPDLGVGTVIASGAVALLSGTAAFEDILTGQTVADCSGTNTVKTLATSKIIETANTHDVFLNIADGWAAGGETALPISGTVTIEWTFMG